MDKGNIHASQLVVKRNKSTILRSLDFTVMPGVITGIIGPSGSGKTTLMRSIVGVQKIKSGSLTILGYSAGAKFLRPKIGYVTQMPAVYDDLTVRQNLKYFGVINRAKKGEIDRIIETVQLSDQGHQLVGALSGGQRARVSLAIALLGDPQILVLDEPTIGLDPILRRELWSLFATFAKEGRTVLVSSHVMDEADRCDNILLLHEGTLLWQESKNELLEHTKTASIESAFINMIQKEGGA